MDEDDPVDVDLNLDDIKAPELPGVDSDIYSGSVEEEERDYEKEHQKISVREHEQQVTDRGKYTLRLFKLMISWIIIVLIIVISTGLEFPLLPRWVSFDLPDSVLLALIGGTTANVIGLFYVVAKHLFPGNH